MEREADESPIADQVGGLVDAQQFALIQFALAEAGRSIDHQHKELVRLRERTVTQLGVATALGTFLLGTHLGQSPTRDGEFWVWMTVTTVLVVVAVAMTYRVWRPVQGWSAKVGATFIVEDYASSSPTFGLLHRLAGFYDEARASNEMLLDGVRRAFRHATVAHAAIVVSCAASLWRLG